QLFLLNRSFHNTINQRLWNHDGAIIIHHDRVACEYGYTAAGNRLLPGHKGQSGHRWRSCSALAPYWQASADDAGYVAHNTIRDQAGNSAHPHALAENIAKNSGIGNAHGIDNSD